MKKNQIEFSTIDLVGSLFVSDSIAQIAQRKCSAQSEKALQLASGAQVQRPDQPRLQYCEAALCLICVKECLV